MKNEGKDENKERLIEAGKLNRSSLSPTSWLHADRNDPKLKECAPVNEDALENLTATYWG